MRSAMRLLPLLLACLLVGQAAAGRVLQQNANQNQFVQIAVTLQGSCAGKGSFPRLLRNSARDDVVAYFASQPAVAATVQGLLVDQCENMQGTDGSALAGFRTSIRFSGLTSFDARQELYRGAAREGCEAGLSPRLYPTILRAISDAGFTLKYNNGDFTNPNGNVGPIPFVNADNCGERPPRPSPTPSPPTPSPSPSPAPVLTCASFTCAVGSVPNPAAVNTTLSGNTAQDQTTCCQPFFDCSNIPNSVFDPTSNSCQCTAAGFNIAAFDGADLKACLANTITDCPANFTTSVRNNNNGIVRCQTPTTPCPEDFNFPLYGGVPATIQQCRSASAGCTFSGFNVPIRNNDQMVIGCVASTNGACPAPFVGFRARDINNFALQECRNVTSCPLYVNANSQFTVRNVDVVGNLRDCLTIPFATNDPVAPNPAGANTCPTNTAGLNSPVEVYFSSPLNCGTTALPCSIDPNNAATFSRTVECRPEAAGCPASQSLMLFNTEEGITINATVVECRQPRATCEGLVLPAGTPNPATYGIPVRSAAGDQLLGCLVSKPGIQCPPAFPTPTLNAEGAVVECRPRASITCGAGQIPGIDATGATVACFAAGTDCGGVNARAFPVSVRSVGFGVEACLAAGSTCPANRPFPFYGNLETNPGAVPILRECWIRPTDNRCQISGYSRPVKTGEAADTLVACLSSDDITTQCPITAGFGLAYRNSQGRVMECRPTTQTACPQTGFNIPGRDGNALVACLEVTNLCPANFPVFVRSALNAESPIVQCTTPTDCPVGFPFSLRSGNTLQGCLGPQTVAPGAQADCTSIRFPGYAGPESIDASNAWVGCATPETTTCLPGFIPFLKVEADAENNPSLEQCRAALPAGATCTTAPPTIGTLQYRVNIRNEANAVVGCAHLEDTRGQAVEEVAVCPNDRANVFTFSAAGVPSITDCLPRDITSCPAIGTPARTFPLYGDLRVQPSVSPPRLGQPRILACIAKPTDLTDCDDVENNDFGYAFTSEVYASQFNNQLVGCIAPSGTACPASQPFVFLTGDAGDFDIDTCRPTFQSCSPNDTPIQTNFVVELRNAANELQGCLDDTTCPNTATYTFPLTMYGPTTFTNGAPVVKQCRTYPVVDGVATVPENCNSYTDFGVELIDAAAPSLIGCVAARTSCPNGAGGDGFPLLARTGVIEQCLAANPAECPSNFEVEVVGGTDLVPVTRACLQTGAIPTDCQALAISNNFPLVGSGAFTVYVQSDASATAQGTLERCQLSTLTCPAAGLVTEFKITRNVNNAAAPNNPLVGCAVDFDGNVNVCSVWATAVQGAPVTCFDPAARR